MEVKKQMVSIKKPEILSPAGDFEALKAAISFGADAVYLAASRFGMRTASKNFDYEEIKQAIEYAHENAKKVYVTCNILPRNKDLECLPEYFKELQNAKADAVIVSDIGILQLAKKYAPNLQVHISTQAGIVNYAAANAFYDLGASRVVLARELTFEEIAEIGVKTPKELEIECFVHGAMCVSFSGRCIISNYLTGRDANQGDCAQPCRWKYHLYEENREGQFFEISNEETGTFLYNSKDLCMIKYIPKLIASGISSLKIEGRAKSAYYSAVTARAYKSAVDDYIDELNADEEKFNENVEKKWYVKELEKISHREYSTGFFWGYEPGQSTHTGGYIRAYDVVAFCEENISGTSAVITQRNKFFKGDILDVLPPSGVSFETIAERIENSDGEEVEATPHAMEKLVLFTSKRIPQGSFIRKKRNF